MTKISIWSPCKNEDEYEQIVQDLFFLKLAPTLLKSKNSRFESTVLQRAWNLQVESQERARNIRRRKPYSLEEIFYVYVLMDPRKPGLYEYRFKDKLLVLPFEPFYVGKGKNDRIYVHNLEVQKDHAHRFQRHKHNLIRKLHSLGLNPVEKKLSKLEIESIAYAKEIWLIKVIGRSNLSRGPLTNETDGKEGSTGLIQSSLTIAKRVEKLIGQKRTEETKAKMAMAARGRTHVTSEETKAKIRASVTGFKHTEEAKARIAKAAGNRPHRPMSEETKAKLRAAFLGKKKSAEHIENMRKAWQVRKVVG